MNRLKNKAGGSRKQEPSTLREELLQAVLSPGDVLWLGGRVDSTNALAKRMIANGFCGRALLAADEQTAGRGRMGRTFYSPGGSGAYFSFLYPAVSGLESAVRITCATSVAVARAIARCTGIETQIKWVNDLYRNGKKVCGILCEAVSGEATPMIVVGIGINLYTERFLRDVAPIAGSLATTPDRLSRETMIAAVMEELLSFIEHPEDGSWLTEYRSRSLVLGKRIRWTTGDRFGEGIAEEIGSGGELLILEDGGGRRILNSGEITLRLRD